MGARKIVPQVLVGVVVVVIAIAWMAFAYVTGPGEPMHRTVHRAARLWLALRNYHQRTGSYPESEEADIETVMQHGLGTTVDDGRTTRTLEPLDGWGRQFRYLSSGDSYVLWSLGRNGKPDRMPGGGEYENRDFDLILTSDGLWQVPARFY